MTEHLAEQTAPRRAVVFLALLIGARVAVALGVYGRVHHPNYGVLPSMGFSSAGTFKAWATTVVMLLALLQLISALWLYGRLPGAGPAPTWLGTAHRTSGTLAFLVSLPVAFFCLYGFGFAQMPWTARILVHSLAGCAFYGAFAAKVVLVHSRRIPRWALPVVGGLLLSTVVLLWLTGSWWFFGVEGVHG